MKKALKIILITIIIIIIILILLIMGNGFGLGAGFGFGNNNGSSSSSESGNDISVTDEVSEEETALSSETEIMETIADNIIRIEVNDTVISVNGQNMENTDALRDYLLSNHTDLSEYVLIETHAIKSVYDDVKAVLNELSYEYTEQPSANE